MNEPVHEPQEDLLDIPAFLRRAPEPKRQHLTPAHQERSIVMPKRTKTTKPKLAKSQKTDPAALAEKRTTKSKKRAARAPKRKAATEPERRSATPKSGASPVGVRADSKQARVVAMLRRPEGATVAQIMDATGWQPHTVRGAIAGAIKKKLGLAVESKKVEGGGRVYRIASSS